MNVFDGTLEARLLKFSSLICGSDCQECHRLKASKIESFTGLNTQLNKRDASNFKPYDASDVIPLGKEFKGIKRSRHMLDDRHTAQIKDSENTKDYSVTGVEDDALSTYVPLKCEDELMSLKRSLENKDKKKFKMNNKKRTKREVITGLSTHVDLATLNGLMSCFDVETTRKRELEKLANEQKEHEERLSDAKRIKEEEMMNRKEEDAKEEEDIEEEEKESNTTNVQVSSQTTQAQLTPKEENIESNNTITSSTTSKPDTLPLFNITKTVEFFGDKINLTIPQGNPLFAPKAEDTNIFTNSAATNFVFGQSTPTVPEPEVQLPQSQPEPLFNATTPSQIIIPGFGDPNITQVTQAKNPFAAQFTKNRKRGRSARR